MCHFSCLLPIDAHKVQETDFILKGSIGSSVTFVFGRRSDFRRRRSIRDLLLDRNPSQTEARTGVCPPGPRGTMGEETRVIYHLEDQDTPYLVRINVPAQRVTLADFKRVLNKPNLKFFFKSVDDDFG